MFSAGSRRASQARSFFRLDPVRCLRLYDLWVSCGWVSSDKAKSQVQLLAGGGAAAPQPIKEEGP